MFLNKIMKCNHTTRSKREVDITYFCKYFQMIVNRKKLKKGNSLDNFLKIYI